MNTPSPAQRTPSPPPHGRAGPPLTPTWHGALTTRSVWWFFAATVAVTWGLGVLTLMFIDQIESTSRPMGYTNPVFVLVVYSPGFVALFMAWRHHRSRGLVAVLRRLTLWRMSTGWWLVLLGMPAVFHAVNGPARPDAQPWDMRGFVLVALAVVLVSRRDLLTLGAGATDVLVPAETPRDGHPPTPDPHRDQVVARRGVRP